MACSHPRFQGQEPPTIPGRFNIERRHGIARATVYWILERNNVTPSRIKPSARSAGTRSDMSHLYAIIEAQDGYIKAMEQLLLDNGIELPTMEGDTADDD